MASGLLSALGPSTTIDPCSLVTTATWNIIRGAVVCGERTSGQFRLHDT